MIIQVLPTLTLGSEPTILIRSQVSSVVSFAGAEQAEMEMMIPAASRAVVSFFMVPSVDGCASIVSTVAAAAQTQENQTYCSKLV
jgi:hypothetical protein